MSVHINRQDEAKGSTHFSSWPDQMSNDRGAAATAAMKRHTRIGQLREAVSRCHK
jgi:hypothetical protein